ncbi:MAG: mannose-1-phosphate guanylyltransferase/mannose-6-phosphate isomerase [Candidatus Omnitrophota bacterium]|jgi:mannose-1-phosphate guanylyltransferase/mannose-6-phosphate isomerase
MRNKSNNYAVILAGGSGTRFWPQSRQSYPKQFLNIVGEKTFLQQTVDRIKSLIPASNIVIVTNKNHAAEIVKQLRGYGVLKKNILLEPEAKNTAPAICWAANVIHQRNAKASLFVLPSDHLITNQKTFLIILKKAIDLACLEYSVTLGIVPTRPDTGYGYLQTVSLKNQGRDVFKVKKFTEKPSLAVAKRYLKQKNYFWNSGMFVWKSEVLLRKFKTYAPKVYDLVGQNISDATIKRNWKRLPSISVDYAILEKDKDVVAVAAQNIGWSDLGSWDSLADVLKVDKDNNIHQGDVLSLASHNNLVIGHKRVITCSDVSDLIIVDTEDALLICKKGNSQNVKNIVEKLKKDNRKVI